MNDKVRIALIGIGHDHATQAFMSLARLTDHFDIAGYTLPENERELFPERMEVLEGFKEMTLDEILNDQTIEAVAVETEDRYLTKYAIMAALHKKHIQMDKPGGFDLEEYEKLIGILKENQTVFHIGYMYRYNAFIKALIEEAKQGELGEIVSVEAQMDCHYSLKKRKWLKNIPGGMMRYLGCHLVDIILQIQGEPKNIIPLSKSTEVEGVTEKDYGFAVLEYENGNSFAKAVMMEFGGFARRQLVVTGSKKTVELKPLEWYEDKDNLYTVKTEWDRHDWGNLGDVTKSPPQNRYDNMMTAFARMVKGEIQNPYTYDYELTLYKTIKKCCGEK